jgi:hypothetical protein
VASPDCVDVFISYAQDEDRGIALDLSDRLEAAGAVVWIADRRIEGAQNYADEIVAAIDSCKVVVVLCSEASLASRHVSVELGIAFESGKPRLPLMLDSTPLSGQIRYWLADANRIDVSGDIEEWFPKVLRSLEALGIYRSDAVLDLAVYRTPGIPSGHFRRPGDIHVHIDGARNTDELFDLLKDLGEGPGSVDHFPGKFNRITRFAGGPQREDKAFAETYRHHTPGSVQQERFDSFSTIWLGSGEDLDASAVHALRRILDVVSEEPHAVVELERVIGVLDTAGRWTEARPPRIADPRSLSTSELESSPRLATSTIEIHHSVDVPKNGDADDVEPPFSVEELPTWPHLGGWFLFDKGRFWSFRSSEFVGRTGEFHYAARAGQRRLFEHLESSGSPYELHTLVEQVLGIWRGRVSPSEGRASLPALAGWELSCPPDGHVWVIAANFYGDQSPDVMRAMLENLRENVTYTYFLRTHADMLRLGLLVAELERGLVDEGFTGDHAREIVTDNIRCVLLSSDFPMSDQRLARLLRFDYFLRPLDPNMGGYRIESSGLSGERISEEDLRSLVDALSPLIEPTVRGTYFSSDDAWTPRLSNHAVVCTDLENATVDLGDQARLRMLGVYDRIVARQISTYGKECIVVRPVRGGYLLVFEQASEAAEWSRRLQFEIRRYNDTTAGRQGGEAAIPEQNIALGYGPVHRVLRAHGYDYVGATVDDCIATAARLHHGLIAMSKSFAAQYEGHVGRTEYLASTSDVPDPDLPGLTLLDWS